MSGTEAEDYQQDYHQITNEELWGGAETTQEEILPDICPYEKIKCAAWNGKSGCEAEFCFMKVTDDGTSV